MVLGRGGQRKVFICWWLSLCTSWPSKSATIMSPVFSCHKRTSRLGISWSLRSHRLYWWLFFFYSDVFTTWCLPPTPASPGITSSAPFLVFPQGFLRYFIYLRGLIWRTWSLRLGGPRHWSTKSVRAHLTWSKQFTKLCSWLCLDASFFKNQAWSYCWLGCAPSVQLSTQHACCHCRLGPWPGWPMRVHGLLVSSPDARVPFFHHVARSAHPPVDSSVKGAHPGGVPVHRFRHWAKVHSKRTPNGVQWAH